MEHRVGPPVREVRLKKREKAIMDAILVLTRSLGRDPTVAEMMAFTRLTKHQVAGLLGKLTDKGIVRKTGALQ